MNQSTTQDHARCYSAQNDESTTIKFKDKIHVQDFKNQTENYSD
jgi:hypothetical protein